MSFTPSHRLNRNFPNFHPGVCCPPRYRFENPILHFSHSLLGIKWHMADTSLWYLFLAPCIMFFIVPNFQQLDLINPGKTQRAQGSLNNWADWACSLAASLPNIQGNHNKTDNTICPRVILCFWTILLLAKLYQSITEVYFCSTTPKATCMYVNI